MAQATGSSCEICEQAPGLNYCLDCEQKFCEGCKVFHKKTKSSKHHEFQLATETIMEVKFKCSDHKEHFILFCKGCDIPVCSRCVAEKHNGHVFSEFIDIVKQLKDRNDSVLQPKLEKIQSYTNQVASGLTKFKRDTQSVIKDIEKEGVRIKAMIDKCIEETINSIKEKAQNESQKVELVLNEMKSQMQSIKQIDKTRKELATARIDGALVINLEALRTEIDTQGLTLPPQLPKITFTRGMEREQDIQNLLGTYNLRTYEDKIGSDVKLCKDCCAEPAENGRCKECQRP